jgi:hypothetical protein
MDGASKPTKKRQTSFPMVCYGQSLQLNVNNFAYQLFFSLPVPHQENDAAG